MPIDVQLRMPAPELQARYRADGLWRDRSLGSFFDAELTACASLSARIWSDTNPYRGTIAEIHDGARRFAAGLHALGIRPGDTITYQLSNRVETLITLYGAAIAGAVIVPIVHFYGPKEVGFIVEQIGARAHVTAAAFGSLDYRP